MKMEDKLEKIKQEIEELKEWINTLDTFVGKLDVDGKMIFCNEAPLKVAGIKFEDVYGKYFPDTIWFSHSEIERKKVVESIEKAKAGFSSRIEISIKGADGSIIPIIFNCQPVIKEGKIKYITVEGKNITEEKKLRIELEKAKRDLEKEVKKRTAELLESEEKYRTLIESSQDGFVIIQDNKFVFVNEAMSRLVNYPKEKIIGKYVTDFMPDEEKERALKNIKKVIERGSIGLQEYKYIKKDGKVCNLQVTSSRITYQGKPAIQAVVRDVTAQKQTEEALIAEKERLAVTLRSIGDGVIVTDAEGKIILLNKIAEKLTGWSQKEAIGKPLNEVFYIINEKTRKRCENPFEKVIKTNGIVGLANDTVLIARDGTERIIADSGAPIRDKDGKIVGVILVFRDITEKRKLEQELIKADKLDSIGILAGGIAHDFNNILTAILGNITLAKIFAKSEERVVRRLEEAERACLRGRDLTQQLLTFSKGGEPIKKLISVAELIKETAGFALTGSNVRCEFSISDDLWSVEADEGQISQVFNNLIINADQAMPDGGIIKISCENVFISKKDNLPLKEGKYVKITIKDQGIGIPKKYLSKIFDPFFTTKKKGSGLGLATAYSIIKKHEGHISVDSEVGKGTTFYIYLPASEKREKVIEKGIEQGIKGKGKVLLMDDEDMILEIVGEMLHFLGYEVEFAKDGNEAIKIYKEAKASGCPFNVVILDLTVPGGMGGKEAIKELKEIDPDVKAIVSSGYSTDPIMADFEKHGFCGVIAKPYKMEELSEILKKVIGEN